MPSAGAVRAPYPAIQRSLPGQAEYDTIAAVKAAVRIPVVANGDIASPEQARDVLRHMPGVIVMEAAPAFHVSSAKEEEKVRIRVIERRSALCIDTDNSITPLEDKLRKLRDQGVTPYNPFGPSCEKRIEGSTERRWRSRCGKGISMPEASV